MRTFVVRVYRSEQKTPPKPGRLTGIVEEVSTGVQAMFYDAEELVAILDPSQPETSVVSAHTAGRTAPLAPLGADTAASARSHNEGRKR